MQAAKIVKTEAFYETSFKSAPSQLSKEALREAITMRCVTCPLQIT